MIELGPVFVLVNVGSIGSALPPRPGLRSRFSAGEKIGARCASRSCCAAVIAGSAASPSRMSCEPQAREPCGVGVFAAGATAADSNAASTSSGASSARVVRRVKFQTARSASGVVHRPKLGKGEADVFIIQRVDFVWKGRSGGRVKLQSRTRCRQGESTETRVSKNPSTRSSRAIPHDAPRRCRVCRRRCRSRGSRFPPLPPPSRRRPVRR